MNSCFKYLFYFIIIISMYCHAIYGNQGENKSREKYKVVIVGAGIAGLGAATHLLRNNEADILILEASDRLGGRVHSAVFGDHFIEYGAQWIHGESGNPVYDLVKPYNVTLVQYFEPLKLIKHASSKINMSLVNELFIEASDIFENNDDLASCNCSMEHYFLTRYENMLKNKTNVDKFTAEAIKDIAIKFQGAHDGTADLSNEGSWGYTQYFESNGTMSVAWRNGYRTLIQILLGEYDDTVLPIVEKTKFNKVVQNINWSGKEVELITEDGSHYYADHVIVTVSLGVLKQSAKDMFIPPLPERKMSAIESLGFDIVNKIFIQFVTHWWPMEFDYFNGLLWTEEDKQRFKEISKHGGWATEIMCFHNVLQQPRLLEGWIVGDAARNLEQLSDNQITDAIIELLQWHMGDKFNISEPINITRSGWASNRFIRGSYSFRSLHSDHFEYYAADIAEPILNNTTPVLLFAGEATHDHYYSTVHGALETGWREADRILTI